MLLRTPPPSSFPFPSTAAHTVSNSQTSGTFHSLPCKGRPVNNPGIFFFKLCLTLLLPPHICSCPEAVSCWQAPTLRRQAGAARHPSSAHLPHAPPRRVSRPRPAGEMVVHPACCGFRPQTHQMYEGEGQRSLVHGKQRTLCQRNMG